MRIATAILYHGLAAIALLAQLVLGIYAPLAITFSAPPGGEVAATIRK